ncbi:hypothetical protein GJ744_007098 [Endocarpon pusillum]|uniref:Uncharacterized protein n=1 Tax=Endocarpon pusillum TaxID=364733 RepID=A0A8H7DXY2_9EURO|nr:hypothetical protein GJ744_007098 [Endocarpon pusillum]
MGYGKIGVSLGAKRRTGDWGKSLGHGAGFATQCEAPVSYDLLRRVNGRRDGLAIHEPFHLNALSWSGRIRPSAPGTSIQQRRTFNSQIKAFQREEERGVMKGYSRLRLFTHGEPGSRVQAPQGLSIQPWETTAQEMERVSG